MQSVITLNELAKATSPVGSSMTFGVSMNMGGAKSFSCPPFIYYALKAKTLCSYGKIDENKLTERQKESLSLLVQSLRDDAKSLYFDLQMNNISIEHYMSTHLQDLFLSRLLNEPVSRVLPTQIPPAISINATRTKKNITIPNYIMRRLIAVMGGDVPARQFIHETAYSVKMELVASGALDGGGKLCGGAENSTWSRKVHNKLLHRLIKLSSIPEVGLSPDIFSIQMLREIKRETISHQKQPA